MSGEQQDRERLLREALREAREGFIGVRRAMSAKPFEDGTTITRAEKVDAVVEHSLSAIDRALIGTHPMTATARADE